MIVRTDKPPTSASVEAKPRHPASCVHPWPHRDRNSQATCPKCAAICKRDEKGKIWFFSTPDDRPAKARPPKAAAAEAGAVRRG